jgi:hypothetical protein
MFHIIIWIIQLSLPLSISFATQEAFAESRRPLPTWAAQLAVQKVQDYLRPQFRRGELLEDAVRLSRLTRPSEVPESTLRQKILEVVDRLHHEESAAADLTLEDLVLTSEIESLVEAPENYPALQKFFRSDRMIMFSRLAIAGGSLTAGYIILRKLGMSDLAIGIIGGWLAGSIQAGPLGEVMKALTSWLLTPVTEFIKVLNARYTAGAEQRINNYLDALKPELNGEPQQRAFLKIANIEQDGMDFAGMSPDEQLENWDKSRRMWVGTAKTYGQLNRDTHHAGRFLIISALNDEQGASTLVQILADRLANLDSRAEALLLFYRAKLDVASSNRMYEIYDAFKKAGDELWKKPDMTELDRQALHQRLDEALANLQSLGISVRDLWIMNGVQNDRVRTVETLVTALTLNEVRSYKMAEANRNLEDEARELQRVIRKGLRLQNFVDQYRPLIQRQMRMAGYKNAPKCEDNVSGLE